MFGTRFSRSNMLQPYCSAPTSLVNLICFQSRNELKCLVNGPLNRVSGLAANVGTRGSVRPMSTEIDKPIPPNPGSNITSTSSAKQVKLIPKRNTNIICLHPDDYKDHCINEKKPPLLARRGEATSNWMLKSYRESDDLGKSTDDLVKMQTPIDLRPTALKRMFQEASLRREISDQSYKLDRVKVLGKDLGAAHFIVARRGRIRFMGHNNWISTYLEKVDREDFPMDVTPFEASCTLPVRYDPNYRVEALDASKIAIHYEGLRNLDGLNYLKWVSFRENKFMDDWCLDRLYCNHGDTLEYLDVSGCSGISLCGLSSIRRLKKLKTLVVENMSHVKDLEVLCALLEDQVPGLMCVGIDYQKKIEQLKMDNEELEEIAREEAAELEASRLEIVPQIPPTIGSIDDLESESQNRNC